jgi:cholesterol oxidase
MKTVVQMGKMTKTGHITGYDGQDVYLTPDNVRRGLNFPIFFIHGEQNHVFRPEATKATFDYLVHVNGSDKYSRQVFPGYGHLDCIYGKNAHKDIFPSILAHLEKTALVKREGHSQDRRSSGSSLDGSDGGYETSL